MFFVRPHIKSQSSSTCISAANALYRAIDIVNSNFVSVQTIIKSTNTGGLIPVAAQSKV